MTFDYRKLGIIVPAVGAAYLAYRCPCTEFLSCSKKEIGSLLSIAMLILVLPPYPL
jgi:uncharacterized membrane protein (DUF4010 family)